MVTLRCTQKLLVRLKAKPESALTLPTTKLGDWYANLLHIGRRQLVLCISERSLLPVVLIAKDSTSLPKRFVEGASWVLSRIDIPDDALRVEVSQMMPLVIGRTASRKVLGVLNEMALQLSFETERHPRSSPEEYALMLADVIYGPIDYRTPIESTRLLFTTPTGIDKVVVPEKAYGDSSGGGATMSVDFAKQ